MKMNGTWATVLQAIAALIGVILAANGHEIAGGAAAVGGAVSSHERINRWVNG